MTGTAEDVEGVAAELGAEVDSLEARLTWLLDDYVDSKSDLLSEMIVGGDLEDENGDIAHTEGLTKKCVTTSQCVCVRARACASVHTHTHIYM